MISLTLWLKNKRQSVPQSQYGPLGEEKILLSLSGIEVLNPGCLFPAKICKLGLGSSALLTQRVVVISCRRFGTTYRFIFMRWD